MQHAAVGPTVRTVNVDTAYLSASYPRGRFNIPLTARVVAIGKVRYENDWWRRSGRSMNVIFPGEAQTGTRLVAIRGATRSGLGSSYLRFLWLRRND
jgi:hypothetical protein